MVAVAAFITDYGRLILEVAVISGGLAWLWRLLKPSPGARRLVEVIVLIAFFMLVAHRLDLTILRTLLGLLIIGLLIVFQQELRHAFVTVLGDKLFKRREDTDEMVETLTEAATNLAHKRIGAIIALERGMDLTQHATNGKLLGAVLSPELLHCIFFPKTALHDGGVILRNGRVEAAGCVFPISQRELNDRSLGLRHRAALGLTESTDAVAVVVSEESGLISLAYKGQLEKGLSPEQLTARLKELLGKPVREEGGRRDSVGSMTSRLEA